VPSTTSQLPQRSPARAGLKRGRRSSSRNSPSVPSASGAEAPASVVAMDVECSPRCGAKAQTKEAMACVPRASRGRVLRARSQNIKLLSGGRGGSRVSCHAAVVCAYSARSTSDLNFQNSARFGSAGTVFFPPILSRGGLPSYTDSLSNRAARPAQAAPPSGAVSERVERARAWSLGFRQKGEGGARAARWCVCRPGVAYLTRSSSSRSQGLPDEAAVKRSECS
jgi:hypothetical protein